MSPILSFIFIILGILIQIQISYAQTVSDLVARAITLIDKNDYAAAIFGFESGNKLDPNNTEAFLQRAYAYIQLKNNEGAFQDAAEAIRISGKGCSIFLRN